MPATDQPPPAPCPTPEYTQSILSQALATLRGDAGTEKIEEASKVGLSEAWLLSCVAHINGIVILGSNPEGGPGSAWHLWPSRLASITLRAPGRAESVLTEQVM